MAKSQRKPPTVRGQQTRQRILDITRDLMVQSATGHVSVDQIAELSQHLGRNVRVQAVGAAVREGILAEVQPAAIVIERRYAGGAMTVRVPVEQIRQVEVRF